MNEIRIGGYIRISRRKARKLYNDGKTIRICPVKCNPCNEYYPMSLDISLNDKFDPTPFEWEMMFDSRVNRYEYYNCNYNELGKYLAYYVKEA